MLIKIRQTLVPDGSRDNSRSFFRATTESIIVVTVDMRTRRPDAAKCRKLDQERKRLVHARNDVNDP